MSVSFIVDTSAALKKELEDVQEKILEEFLNDWADAVLFEARRLLARGKIENSRDPVNRGAFDLGGLAEQSLVIKTGDDEREVRFTSIYALATEYGRPPGSMPPVGPIIAWAKRNGLRNPTNAGWAIANKMKKEGMPPRPFLRQSVLTVERRLQEIFDDTMKRF